MTWCHSLTAELAKIKSRVAKRALAATESRMTSRAETKLPVIGVTVKHNVPAYLGIILVNIVFSSAANASQFKLPEEIGRVEAPRDMNIFAVEPSIIDERYYTSGRSERHQFVGNVLPEGADIPDNDAPLGAGMQHKPAPVKVEPTKETK